ncbi:MAG: sulfotransferase domain-containing protein, partial [Polyangiaceae bacterium]|nr:sulfotransferase domain-containing protein [Polyangiaceae bacterium]
MRSSPGRLPDFLIIGAAKSGTTTLFRYLINHSRVFDLAEKEPCFFDAEVNWGRGLDWYRNLFVGARDDQLCGEASTNYTRYPQVPGVPERIKRVVPDAKLIY